MTAIDFSQYSCQQLADYAEDADNEIGQRVEAYNAFNGRCLGVPDPSESGGVPVRPPRKPLGN